MQFPWAKPGGAPLFYCSWKPIIPTFHMRLLLFLCVYLKKDELYFSVIPLSNNPLESWFAGIRTVSGTASLMPVTDRRGRQAPSAKR